MCYAPLDGWADGKGGLTLSRGRAVNPLLPPIKVSCGQCLECKGGRSREWATRIIHEMKFHDQSWFATVTYDDAHLPPGGDLRLRDLQKFIKRLRRGSKKFGMKPHRFRYFACGEYGTQTMRPHYHVVFFGLRLVDLKCVSKKVGREKYTSASVDRCWTDKHGKSKGGITIELMSDAFAFYVGKYVSEQVSYDNDRKNHVQFSPYEWRSVDGVVVRRARPFSCQSRRPGIGAAFLEKYLSQLVSHGSVRLRNGKLVGIPRFYLRRIKEQFPDAYEKFKRDWSRARFLTRDNRTPEALDRRGNYARAIHRNKMDGTL